MAADDQRDENKLLLRNLQYLVDAGRVQEEADVITNEYTRYIDEVVAKDRSKYSDFQSSPNSAGDTDTIDVLFLFHVPQHGRDILLTLMIRKR